MLITAACRHKSVRGDFQCQCKEVSDYEEPGVGRAIVVSRMNLLFEDGFFRTDNAYSRFFGHPKCCN